MAKKRFSVALSFPGEYRSLVKQIADGLSGLFTRERILYDRYHQAEFARPNLDIYLQNLYENESELVVIFICSAYDEKEWCGIEWRALRALMNSKKADDRIMFLKCGEGSVAGLFGTVDGFIDTIDLSTNEIINHISRRHSSIPNCTIITKLSSTMINNKKVSDSYSSSGLGGNATFDYSNNNGLYTLGIGDKEFTTKWSKAGKRSIHALSDHPSIDCIARCKKYYNIGLIPNLDELDFSSRARTPELGDAVVWINKFGNVAVTRIESIKDDSRGDSCDELMISYWIFLDCKESNTQGNTTDVATSSGTDQSNHHRLEIDKQQSATVRDRKHVIVEYLETQGNAKVSDLRNITGLSDRSVRRLLNEMLNERTIVRIGDNRNANYVLRVSTSE